MADDATDALIYPVGHYGGRFYPDAGATLRYHTIRVGTDARRLTDETEFRAWALAHGPADRDPALPWTAATAEQAAGELTGPAGGAGDVTAALTALTERGLIATVRPGTRQARAFAAAYRIQPLLMGLGNTPDRPDSFHIGLVGAAPLVTAGWLAGDLWQWGHACADLWAACELLAGVAAKTGETDPSLTDPERVLAGLFPALRALIARNAAYLDVV